MKVRLMRRILRDRYSSRKRNGIKTVDQFIVKEERNEKGRLQLKVKEFVISNCVFQEESQQTLFKDILFINKRLLFTTSKSIDMMAIKWSNYIQRFEDTDKKTFL